jgi:rhodanese-related sulfurtransferase
MTQVKTVDVRRLKEMLHDGTEFALLDIREAGQFGESHVLFAVPCPYSRIELDIGRLVPRKSAPVVLTDDGRSGIAERAVKRLQTLGYTDIAVVEGGNAAWVGAGYVLFAGVNVPSKIFGELVEHVYRTPRITAGELMRMKQANEDCVVIDGRPVEEHHRMTIPGSICCPNGEMPLRLPAIVRNPKTKIVVNCAGRTRSIIGAQTLINFGVPNPVYALENGTQGWVLADFELERSSDHRYPAGIDESALPALQTAAEKLMDRFAVGTVSAHDVHAWLNDEKRTTYLIDVRTPEEFRAGTIVGAVHAPGGQLIQATDQWVGVRNARIVLIDSGENVRSPVVASWLKQMGYDIFVLDGGVKSGLKGIAAAKPSLPALLTISAADLKRALDTGRAAAIDLGQSMNFRKAHIPGSRWSIRPRLIAAAQPVNEAIVLVAEDDDIARLAAIDLIEAGIGDVRIMAGGLAAWTGAGFATEASPGVPPDIECIDYLFFVHDRHAGNREAMKQYLAWETGLTAKLDDQDRASFKVSRADGRRPSPSLGR